MATLCFTVEELLDPLRLLVAYLPLQNLFFGGRKVTHETDDEALRKELMQAWTMAKARSSTIPSAVIGRSRFPKFVPASSQVAGRCGSLAAFRVASNPVRIQSHLDDRRGHDSSAE